MSHESFLHTYTDFITELLILFMILHTAVLVTSSPLPEDGSGSGSDATTQPPTGKIIVQLHFNDAKMLFYACSLTKIVFCNYLLGRHGSASLCRVERKNKMAATYMY